MTNKKKLILTILSCVFIAFACIFGFTIANKQDLNVKADTLDTNYQFSTSGFYIPYSNFSSANNSSVDTSAESSQRFVNIKFFFGYADNGVSRSTFLTSSNQNNEFLPSSPGNNIYIRYDSNMSGSVANYVNFNPYTGQGNWSEYYGYMLNTSTFFPYTWNLSSSNFTYNIVKLSISSRVGGFWGKSNLNEFKFIFYDNNNNNLTICFTCYAGYLGNNMKLDERIYYFNSFLTDNEFYQAGKQQGLLDNQSNIYDKGYNDAIDENKSDWEQVGYNRGIQDANDYTFLGLIGATIDAPISALFGYIDTDSSSPTYNQRIGGFFNFELLGVNLKDFFFAVLTFAVVIVIVRFAIGK